MSEERIDITEETNRAWKKAERREKRKRIKEWAEQNPQMVVAGVTVALGLVGKGVKSLFKVIGASAADRKQQMKWYDPSLGHYWQLRRPMRKEEALEVNRRRKNGETLGDIFESMKILR